MPSPPPSLLVTDGYSPRKPMSTQLLKIRKEMLQNNSRPRVSFLENGKNVILNNSEMTAIGEVKHVRNNYYIDSSTGGADVGKDTTDHGLYLLSKSIAHGAMHDSSERFPPPRCDLKGNRSVIEAIHAWATDLTASSSLLWVTRPKNADKSVTTGIAQTIAEQLAAEGRLGGCFFFDSNMPIRDRETALFSTMAYQIAMNKPEMRSHVSSAMRVDPTFPTKDVHTQLQNLIVRPFRRMMFSSVINPQVSTIIIDALEECGSRQAQLAILQEVLAEVEQKTPIPLRFLILGEPKEYIRDLLEDYASAKIVLRIDLQIRELDPQQSKSKLREQLPDQEAPELLCRSMPSATPEVMSLLESLFSQRTPPYRPMRLEAKTRITGFSPVDVVMNSSKGSASSSYQKMQVSGASLTRTNPSSRTSSSSAASPMSVDPASHFSSLRSAMSVDIKSMPKSRGSHHSLSAWTTTMEITQEPPATRGRDKRKAKELDVASYTGEDSNNNDSTGQLSNASPVPMAIPKRSRSSSTPFGRVHGSASNNSWQMRESGTDGSHGFWASEIANHNFRCRSCFTSHGPLPCPQTAGLLERP